MSTQRSMTLDLFEALAEPEPPNAAPATPGAKSTEERAGLTKAAPREMHAALREVLGEAVCSEFESEFHLIEIAEETIKRYADRSIWS